MVASAINDRDKVAGKLQEALQATDSIIDHVPIGIKLVSKEKVVLRANQAALRILGRSENEIVGLGCHKNICPFPDGKCPILDEGRSIDQSHRILLGREGKEVSVYSTVIPYNYKGEDVLMEAFIDTTEQNKKNDELLETVRELRQFNRLAVGREQRMLELKAEVNDLLAELNQEIRYQIQESPTIEVEP